MVAHMGAWFAVSSVVGVGVAPGLAAPGLAPMGLGLGVYEIVLRAIEAWCYGLFLSGLAVTYSPTT
tara:strand:- start:353 stop:550 length:198 start_codon:yes stop_codon:yes gene_type:complete